MSYRYLTAGVVAWLVVLLAVAQCGGEGDAPAFPQPTVTTLTNPLPDNATPLEA